MITKIYALVWVVGLASAAIFYLTGNLNPVAQIVFGFLTFGTVFMGMLAILPAISTHRSPTKH